VKTSVATPAPSPVAPAPPPLDDAPVAGPPAATPSLADEPIAAAAPLDASPASEAVAPAPAEPSPAERPVTIIKGLGPKVAARLGEQGVATVGDLAALSDDQAEALDARLGPFTGRMARDRWLEQARFLAAGDDKGFEAVFGRL
jgi:predicted flap endonuclease-1-like 5' DNA nuclease